MATGIHVSPLARTVETLEWGPVQLPAFLPGERLEARDGKKIRKTFPTVAAAKSWRSMPRWRSGKAGCERPTRTTLREAGETCLRGVRGKARYGHVPATLQAEHNPQLRTGAAPAGAPRAGGKRLSEITADGCPGVRGTADGRRVTASTIQMHRAAAAGDLPPRDQRGAGRGRTHAPGSSCPPSRSPRRIASPAEAEALIAALPTATRDLGDGDLRRAAARRAAGAAGRGR